MSTFPEGLEPLQDLDPADWVETALKDWPAGPFRVRDLVPPVFDAYARILHRPHRPSDGREPTGTWRELATELGRPLSLTTSWKDLERISPDGTLLDDWSVMDGSLSKPEAATLAASLTKHTAHPDSCWFAIWSGFGFLTSGGAVLLRAPETLRERWANRAIRRAERKADRRAERALATLPTFPLLGQSGRSYFLLGGGVSDASRFTFDGWFQSPTLWWPDDRAWFVHTEIDSMSTYVGGSRRLVDELVGQQILESFEAAAADRAAL
jgi:hypothetical protein